MNWSEMRRIIKGKILYTQFRLNKNNILYSCPETHLRGSLTHELRIQRLSSKLQDITSESVLCTLTLKGTQIVFLNTGSVPRQVHL